ncbi:hypothetical protein CHS0354_006886 [Potamilus streckersoni]|uniref:SGNH hydrolase-type esterase domain-containing protein n=1 Tax=Potamilus streckersoni TaxID=2493646 RepID=A0AAE0TF92_9BIVA|nr:hypothetical protein CHS0354_006886 [Potamilus streckersoni]
MSRYLLFLFFWATVFSAVNTPATAQSNNKITKIAFLGDSLTEGYGVDEYKSYPFLAEKELNTAGYRVSVINAGISGSTSASGLRRVQWLMRNNPDILVLALGANDGLRGLSTEELEKNLTETARYAMSKNALVILAGMHVPPNYGQDGIHPNETGHRMIADIIIPYLKKHLPAQSG